MERSYITNVQQISQGKRKFPYDILKRSLSKAIQNLPVNPPACAPEGLSDHPENPPHAGLYIPGKASRTIQIITRTSSSFLEFHIEFIANTDTALQWNDPGKSILWLLLPHMIMHGNRCIPWFIRRHHCPKDNSVPWVCFPYRCCRIPMHLTAEYFPCPGISGKPVCKPF